MFAQATTMVLSAANSTIHGGGINWQAVSVISGPLFALVGWLGHMMARKLNLIGEHLEEQDKRSNQISERVARLEGPMRQVVSTQRAWRRKEG